MLGHAQYNTKHQCLCAPQSREPQNNRFLRRLVTKESPGPCLDKLLFCFSWSAWRYASRHPDDKHSFFRYENRVTTLRGPQKPGYYPSGAIKTWLLPFGGRKNLVTTLRGPQKPGYYPSGAIKTWLPGNLIGRLNSWLQPQVHTHT